MCWSRFLFSTDFSELRSCVKVEVAVRNKPYSLCGRKPTLKRNAFLSELGSCVKVEVTTLSSPSLVVLVASVDVEHN